MAQSSVMEKLKPVLGNSGRSDERRLSVRRIKKNVFMVSLVFLLLFTAFNGLANLQSSLHIQAGLGVVTQAVIYATFVVSALLTPTLVINKLGHKWTMSISMIFYILWMAANGYAVWATMIPASFMVGLSAAPLWTGQLSYFAALAVEYAKLQNDNTESVLSVFCGIFLGMFRIGGIFGSVIGSAVLNRPSYSMNDNGTGYEAISRCGKDDCPWNNKTNVYFEKQSSILVWTLVGIFLAIGIVALILSILFVDPLPSYLVQKRETTVVKREILQLCLATIKHLRNIKQLLLIMLPVFMGSNMAFYVSEYNKSWVTCSLGIWWVGWLMVGYGVVSMMVCFVAGRLVKYVGRKPIFFTGFISDAIIYLTLVFWSPQPGDLFVFLLIPVAYGVSNGIWTTQLRCLYGIIFSKDTQAAYSNLVLWNSLGSTLVFSYSAYLCASVKLYIQIGIYLAGMFGYVTVEIIEHMERR